MRITALCLFGAALAAFSFGCGSAAEPQSSTITGTIDQSTFAEAVQSIQVISDQSAPTTATVAADGSFTLTLQEGAAYRFLVGDGEGVPLILRNEGDRLQTMITITGGNAKTDIGMVRFWGGQAALDAAEIQAATDATVDSSCVDGFIARTGEPCSTGEATVTCEDMGGRGFGKHHGGPGDHAGAPPPPHHEEGEGVTVVDDPATDASRDQAVAIPERTLDTSIGCGGCPGM